MSEVTSLTLAAANRVPIAYILAFSISGADIVATVSSVLLNIIESVSKL